MHFKIANLIRALSNIWGQIRTLKWSLITLKSDV